MGRRREGELGGGDRGEAEGRAGEADGCHLIEAVPVKVRVAPRAVGPETGERPVEVGAAT